MRGKSVHIDSRFITEDMDTDDAEACMILHKTLFSLLRSGRLSDAKCLLENVSLSAVASFVFIREFLTNPNLSPLDPYHENFDLAKSRAYFKQAAREIIPIVCIFLFIVAFITTAFRMTEQSQNLISALGLLYRDLCQLFFRMRPTQTIVSGLISAVPLKPCSIQLYWPLIPRVVKKCLS